MTCPAVCYRTCSASLYLVKEKESILLRRCKCRNDVVFSLDVVVPVVVDGEVCVEKRESRKKKRNGIKCDRASRFRLSSHTNLFPKARVTPFEINSQKLFAFVALS